MRKAAWDYRINPVTCKASEVLTHGTGYCYAKSHLLAALLRANAIPVGLCYQRLTVESAGPPYCLHGLNTAYLGQYGWYRIDARGNKPSVLADCCPPIEKLAFPVIDPLERDFPEIWAEPLPLVVNALTMNSRSLRTCRIFKSYKSTARLTGSALIKFTRKIYETYIKYCFLLRRRSHARCRKRETGMGDIYAREFMGEKEKLAARKDSKLRFYQGKEAGETGL